MGKFLIKGKRLNKLESIFAPDAAAEDTDVTEEDESNDEDEDEQKSKVCVCVWGGSHHGRHLYSQQTFLLHVHFISF